MFPCIMGYFLAAYPNIVNKLRFGTAPTTMGVIFFTHIEGIMIRRSMHAYQESWKEGYVHENVGKSEQVKRNP